MSGGLEESPFYFILKIDNLDSFDINNLWDDVDTYIKGIEAFNGSEDVLSYSKIDTYYINDDLGEEYACIMA